MKVNRRELEHSAVAAGWTPATCLSRLCEQELQQRLQQRYKRYLKEARLPAGKTVNTRQLESLQGINPAVIQHLGDQHDWIDQGDKLLLFGGGGLGKTHSAAAICREPVAHGIRGRFYGATDLVQQLQEAKQALKLNELLLKPDRYRFLVVVDIGYVSRDQQETGVLFELIAHRYGQSTIQPVAQPLC